MWTGLADFFRSENPREIWDFFLFSLKNNCSYVWFQTTFSLDLHIINNHLKIHKMRRLKMSTVEQQMRDGKIECITNLRIGHVEIRNSDTGKKSTIEVINNK